jgi:hypothetical protein
MVTGQGGILSIPTDERTCRYVNLGSWMVASRRWSWRANGGLCRQPEGDPGNILGLAEASDLSDASVGVMRLTDFFSGPLLFWEGRRGLIGRVGRSVGLWFVEAEELVGSGGCVCYYELTGGYERLGVDRLPGGACCA